MKPFAIALTSALLASAATTALHALFLRPASVTASGAAKVESVERAPRAQEPVAAVAPAALSGREQELLARLDELEHAFARLDDDVKLGAVRSAVDEPSTATNAAVAPDVVRQLANQVIEENKAKEKAELEIAQVERDKERARLRAERAATKLGLSAADQEQLALVYEGESAKQRELFAKLGFDEGKPRDFLAFGPELRDQMRDGMGAIREWRGNEMVARFGSSLAGEIAEYDSQRRDRGFGGDRGGDGGFFGAWSGGGAGGKKGAKGGDAEGAAGAKTGGKNGNGK